MCDQIRRLHRDGHEVALHIHPQWANAQHRDGVWELDYSEYNLGELSRGRIESIVDECLEFLRSEIQDESFRPIAFRAGNWLIQPAERIAHVLADRGIKIDSSLFKGGFHRKPSIDYRAAARNPEPYWRFRSDVNRPDPDGVLIEVPIYTVSVPMWRMVTRKRLTLQRRSIARRKQIDASLGKWLDYARPNYPLKFDFCRMTLPEMTSMVEREASQRGDRQGARPMVAIGHTKDLEDAAPIDEFLHWLHRNGIGSRLSLCLRALPWGGVRSPLRSRQSRHASRHESGSPTIDWNPELPIFASERYLAAAGKEYGWLAGVDSKDRVRCILPYVIPKNPLLRMVRFPVQTLLIDPELNAADEQEFLDSAMRHFRRLAPA